MTLDIYLDEPDVVQALVVERLDRYLDIFDV